VTGLVAICFDLDVSFLQPLGALKEIRKEVDSRSLWVAPLPMEATLDSIGGEHCLVQCR
jgi:hypothetical protein